MQQCIKILLFLILNEVQHVSDDTSPIIRNLKLHKQPLVMHMWRVVRRAVVGRPTTLHICKTRGCLCSFRFLMMGGVSPETCWASFKIRNNKSLIHCCILLVFHCTNCTMMHGSTNIKTKSIIHRVTLKKLSDVNRALWARQATSGNSSTN